MTIGVGDGWLATSGNAQFERERGLGVAPHLIGIAGPSCAGKSELACWLASRLKAPVLNLDHYYIDMADLPLDERAKRNFDEPSALEDTLILEHARRLAAGEAIRAPRYDFASAVRGMLIGSKSR